MSVVNLVLSDVHIVRAFVIVMLWLISLTGSVV